MADIQMVINLPEDMMKWMNNPNRQSEYGIGDFMDVIRQGKLIPVKKARSPRAVRLTDDDIAMCCAEIEFDVEIGFVTTCRATARNHIRRMNEWLEDNHYDWRVGLTVDKGLRFPYGAKVVGASSDTTE